MFFTANKIHWINHSKKLFMTYKANITYPHQTSVYHYILSQSWQRYTPFLPSAPTSKYQKFQQWSVLTIYSCLNATMKSQYPWTHINQTILYQLVRRYLKLPLNGMPLLKAFHLRKPKKAVIKIAASDSK